MVPDEHESWIRRADPGDPPEFTGERFVPGVPGEIEAEHVARYLFAAALCRGKRVLDIACGEGYGSAMLAQVAAEVVGVDIDKASVDHANKAYGSATLRFEEGSCEQIPAKRGRFDVVVSFETIEHIEDHARFLREVRRVLRPGGLFVCSTPDKSVYLAGQEPNPFHRKELSGAEFEDLVSSRFEHVKLFAQRLVCGSIIAHDDRNRTELVRTRDGVSYGRTGPGDGATYLIAVCSDDRLPRAPDQILSDERYSIGRVTSLTETRDRLRSEMERLDADARAARERAGKAEARIEHADADLQRAASARDHAEAERARLAEDRGRLIAERRAAENERDAAIRDLASAQVDYQRAAAELDSVRAALIEAREKAAAAQASLAATKSESETLRRTTREALDGREQARESQKQAEIRAARAEERADALQAQRDALRSERNALASERDERRRDADRHASQSALRLARAERAERAATDAQAEVARLREELAWTLATRSWRWSRPLRLVSGAGRAAAVRSLGAGARLVRTLRLPGEQRLATARRAALVRGSRLFDPGFYLRQNPDVRAAGVDPAWHFAARGGFEGRDPSERFSTAWYLANNPDVAAAGVHPFEHFITRGVIEGRTPRPPAGGGANRPTPPAAADPAPGPAQVPAQEPAPGPARRTDPPAAPDSPPALIEVREAPPLAEVDPSRLARTKVLAFYLPQFHPIPENDAWWGKGFTEWANVTRARPMFDGHAQPVLPGELGFYDLRVPEVRERQAELARAAGIHGFCYHHYWFNGRRILERPLDEVLRLGRPDFPFCVCWANENWTRRWDGLEQEILLEQKHTLASDRRFILDLIPYLEDPRYVRVDGRPVVLVYRADLMADAADTAAVWRDECLRAGLGEIHLCAVRFRTTDPRPLGFDAAVEFPPHHFPAPEITRRVPGRDPEFRGVIQDYAAGVRAVLDRPARPGYRLYRAVMPSWDNTARRMHDAIVHHGADPQLYEAWLRSAINQPQPDDGIKDNLVFVNAWNEWAEGTVLEPRRDLGDAYLRATARVLRPAADPGPAHAPAPPAPAGVAPPEPEKPAPEKPSPDTPAPPEAPPPAPGLEDRLKRVVRTTPALNAFLARHPAIKNRAAGIVRKVAAAPEPKAAPVPADAPARLNWRGKSGSAPDAPRLLVVSHDAALAGAQLIVLENVAHWTDAGIDCRVLLLGSGDLEPRFTGAAPTACIADVRAGSVGAFVRLALDDLSARGWKPDAAFCNTVASAEAAETLSGAGVPVLSAVYELPTSIDDALGGRKSIDRIMRASRRVIVASAFVRDRLSEAYAISPERLEPLHTGVLSRVFPDRETARRALRRELGVRDDTLLVLGCGSVHHRKGADLFVAAAARAVAEIGRERAVFVWVGEDQCGPTFRNWCQHDIQRSGLEGVVRFIGKRSDPSAWFAGSDIFALTSREDPFPMVNLEALAAGLGVVAFDGAGGAVEALRPDRGVIVPYADAGAMGAAIAELAREPARLAALRDRTKTYAADRLGWPRYTDAIRAMIAESCSPRFSESARARAEA